VCPILAAPLVECMAGFAEESISTLTVFSDESQTQVIAEFHGSPDVFRPFVIPGGVFSYALTPALVRPKFAVKVELTAFNGLWSQEFSVLRSPSPQWSVWVLNFLLTELEAGQRLPQNTVHNASVLKLLLEYLQTPSIPFKAQVISVLTRLLAFPAWFDGDSEVVPLLSDAARDLSGQISALQSRLADAQFFAPQYQQAWELLAAITECHRVLRSPPECHNALPFKPSDSVVEALVPPLDFPAQLPVVASLGDVQTLVELRCILLHVKNEWRMPDRWVLAAVEGAGLTSVLGCVVR
jgi:hypothetical protein